MHRLKAELAIHWPYLGHILARADRCAVLFTTIITVGERKVWKWKIYVWAFQVKVA